MPYVGKKPADIIATAVDTTTGTFSGEVDAASLDISGDIDVDGTTNLDAVDIDGTVTVGSNTSDLRFNINSANQYPLKFLHAGNVSGHIGGGGSDILRFSNAAGGTIMEMNAGQITKPLQPAFNVRPTSNQLNLAEDDTIVFGTERFDQNGDFASNTFTAPVTGKYQFSISIRADNMDTDANWTRIELVTSNYTYLSSIIDLGGLSADPVHWYFNFSVLADLDASDTALVKWGQNAGVAQADIDTQSAFSGYLVA